MKKKNTVLFLIILSILIQIGSFLPARADDTEWEYTTGYEHVLEEPGHQIISVEEKYGTSLKIKWTKNVPYVEYYELWRSTSCDGTYKKVKTFYDRFINSYTHRVKKGVTYYYKIVTHCIGGYAKESNIVSGKVSNNNSLSSLGKKDNKEHGNIKIGIYKPAPDFVDSNGIKFETVETPYTYISKRINRKKLKVGYSFTAGNVVYTVRKISKRKTLGSKNVGELSIRAKNKNIKGVIVPDWILINGKVYKIRKVEAHGFENCKKMKYMELPLEDIRLYGAYAFNNCTELEYIGSFCEITNSKEFYRAMYEDSEKQEVEPDICIYATTIGKCAFQNCEKLRGSLELLNKAWYNPINEKKAQVIYYPKKKYYDYAFAGCKSITQVTGTFRYDDVLPEGFFFNCENIEYTEYMPIDIRSKAYQGCVSLSRMEFSIEKPMKIADDAFPLEEDIGPVLISFFNFEQKEKAESISQRMEYFFPMSQTILDYFYVGGGKK